MNNINIFQELADLKQRQDLSLMDIATAAGSSKSATQHWFDVGRVDNKYLWNIADGVGDSRFKLAVLCYQKGFPDSSLSIIDKYNNDPLSRLRGTQIEDSESDSALQIIIDELCNPKPDLHLITSKLAEIADTMSDMYLLLDELPKLLGISKQKIFMERSEEYARA